eukprot:11173774-Lingulodinium_polyedra.AAC.1
MLRGHSQTQEARMVVRCSRAVGVRHKWCDRGRVPTRASHLKRQRRRVFYGCFCVLYLPAARAVRYVLAARRVRRAA